MPPRRRRSRRSPRNRRQVNPGWVLVLLVVAVIGVGWASGGFGELADRLGDGSSTPDDGGNDRGGNDRGGDGGGDSGDGSGGSAGVDVDRARSLLDGLTVAGWDSMSGYNRDLFPHWRERDGCDTRETVLARDGEDVTVEEDTCEVTGGSWHSVYDGDTFTDPSDVDIDHLVPLANAWRTGASGWDERRRTAFANDLERPQLIAVSATSNRTKGDQDPSQWRPPERDYWCTYAHDWVVVKDHWELSVTSAERDALDEMLRTCG